MKVSYETALLAKEKGFKWSTTYEYKSEECVSHRDYIPHDYNSRGLLSAPLQYELQKWLREVHNIDINPFMAHGLLPECTWEYAIQTSEPSYLKSLNKHYKTYEEALEAGLIRSLKLLL